MIGIAKQTTVAVLFSLPKCLSLAFAQTGGNPGGKSHWDPIHGWTDGNPATREGIGSGSSGRQSSFWSSYQQTRR